MSLFKNYLIRNINNSITSSGIADAYSIFFATKNPMITQKHFIIIDLRGCYVTFSYAGIEIACIMNKWDLSTIISAAAKTFYTCCSHRVENPTDLDELLALSAPGNGNYCWLMHLFLIRVLDNKTYVCKIESLPYISPNLSYRNGSLVFGISYRIGIGYDRKVSYVYSGIYYNGMKLGDMNYCIENATPAILLANRNPIMAKIGTSINTISHI